MQRNINQTHHYLQDSEFEPLFVEELGWEYHTQALTVTVDDTEYALSAIAEKRGMVVFHCTATDGKPMPDYATRRAIQRQVAKSVHEHVIIYTDAAKTTQLWQWVKREQGKPNACREHRYHREQPGDALLQKLRAIEFSLAEEEGLSIVDVTGRVRAAFDVAPVTKRFYERFKKEHDAFLKFLNGIPDMQTQEWYVSVMLNRLMFIYFIQKKGFLNADPDYLRTNLTRSRARGTDWFYKTFLCPLFFEGFAKPETERTAETNQRLGEVPYLNGGIFQRHQIERQHGEAIHIPDAAFEQLFNFFEQYQWHLDERPLRNDNEINPDVLGYIFEKYVNDRQKMGAYYTPEDITKYISTNTIIPFLFDAARKGCSVAFEGEASVWSLLQANPNRYIYDAVKTGVKHPLPPEIAAGIDDVSQRTEWNTPAPEPYNLPTEIWREVVARRQRYQRVHAKLANGEITDINALITENLDIWQFAQDVIETYEGPDLLRAFWNAITKVTILDPTCGSGAFLFAALNILEPLYEACLERMQAFVDEAPSEIRRSRPTEWPVRDTSRVSHSTRNAPGELGRARPTGPPVGEPSRVSIQKYPDFRKILARIAQHPNRRYFILKSIIINNLYGVDIMDEAVEICKLRLFLKMVAQIDDGKQIEPLPDIDFNVQAGNTLVGYTTYEEVENAVTGTFDFDDTMARIRERTEDVENLFNQFRQQQTELDGDVTLTDKQKLQQKLAELEAELNGYLAGEYRVDADKESDYQQWLSSHQPFHWFLAFYGILDKGGFDVIIGNPPYVEYRKVKKDYKVRGYETKSCGNLYAFVVERSFRILQPNGWKSMIIPHSAYCTDRMSIFQSLFHGSERVGWVQTYGERPAKLFVGAEQSLAIYIYGYQEAETPAAVEGRLCVYSSRYHKWNERFRPHLFDVAAYADVTQLPFQNSIPKIQSVLEKRVWEKLSQFSVLGKHLDTKRESRTIHYHNAARYFIRAMDFVPYFWNERDGEKISTQLKPLYLATALDAAAVCATLNSSLFYWWYIVLSDCRHVNLREIRNFPIGLAQMDDVLKERLSALTDELMADLKQHARRKETQYKATGRVVYDEFSPRHSKPIIDKIDRVLAEHYGFTDEELDFIINYDIKYRLGLGS